MYQKCTKRPCGFIRLSLALLLVATIVFSGFGCGTRSNDSTDVIRDQLEEHLKPTHNPKFYQAKTLTLNNHYDQPSEAMLWEGAIAGLLSGVTDQALLADIEEEAVVYDDEENTFLLIFQAINEHYILEDKTDLTEDDFWMLAMLGLLESLDDPYSRHLTLEDFQAAQQSAQESYVGIGVGVVDYEDNIRIVRVFSNSPAEEAGLMAGDIITHVDGIDVREMSYELTLTLVLGDVDTDVEIGIERPGAQDIIFITMTRRVIETPTAEGWIDEDWLPQDVGYLRINTFGEQTAAIATGIIDDFIAAGYQSLIVDVRNNGGGALGTLNNLLALFITSTVNDPSFTIQWSDGDVDKYYSTGTPLVDVPVVVLINEYSASAAEVFASALHEVGGFDLVGATTYGKGSVQSGFWLGAAGISDIIWLTTGNWFTASGNNVRDVGYEPNVSTPQNPYVQTPSIFVGATPFVLDDEDDIIDIAQRILNAVDDAGLNEDGIFDLDTKLALEAFQTANGLAVTGELDAATAVKLTEAITAYRNDFTNDWQLDAAVITLVGVPELHKFPEVFDQSMAP